MSDHLYERYSENFAFHSVSNSGGRVPWARLQPLRHIVAGTEKVLLEHECEYMRWITVPGRRIPRARLQSPPTNRKF